MADDDIRLIVCVPCAQQPQVIAGTEARPCSYCAVPVWVAPSSRLLLETMPDARIVCNDCTVDLMEAHRDEDLQVSTVVNELENTPRIGLDW